MRTALALTAMLKFLCSWDETISISNFRILSPPHRLSNTSENSVPSNGSPSEEMKGTSETTGSKVEKPPSSSPLYDQLGEGYTQTRHADPRMANALLRELKLPTPSIIADVGAGTGNYARSLAAAGYEVVAVEPSEVMAGQAGQHDSVRWVRGEAEAIPLEDGAVDGVVCVLAFHHFGDSEKAAQEMVRISGGGTIVIFTFDPRTIEAESPWFAHYFPGAWDATYRFFPPLEDVAGLFRSAGNEAVETTTFPLPHDLRDAFAGAAWRSPELYLKPEVRAGISSFRLADPAEVESGVAQLEDDLKSGRWDEQFGELRERTTADVGYRLITSRRR
jgi:ubiquinone/menaquinone biosynthesis C-methylase UbiE